MTNEAITKCTYETNKSLRFEKHQRGFTAYTVEPGQNLILTIHSDERKEGTSTRLSKVLVLEVQGKPPVNKKLDTKKWVSKALYKFGTQVLQFESQTVTGSITLKKPEDDGICHGEVDLFFTKPTIDIFHMDSANLKLSF
jgi:hypothetical protein